MNLARLLAAALVLALLLPGFAAAVPQCAMNAMKPCETVMAAGEHDCCPPAPAELDTPCCEQSHVAPATPARSAERPDTAGAFAATASAAFAAPAAQPISSAHATVAGGLQPPDRLAMGCILRI